MTILMVSFFVLLLAGIPVAAVMGISSMLYLMSRGTDILTIPQRMFAGADSFSLMAIPLYIFAMCWHPLCLQAFPGLPLPTLPPWVSWRLQE